MSEATDKLDALLAEMPPDRSAHLTFEDKCAAFYLIQRGYSQTLVAEVFGVTQTAMSRLARALKPEARTYRSVAEEWNRIGSTKEFGDRYYTVDIHDRVTRARAKAPEPADLRRGRGPNRNLEPWPPFVHYEAHYTCVWRDETNTPEGEEIVDYETGEKLPARGWTFFFDDGGPHARVIGKRFRTPAAAKDFILKNM